MQSTRNATGSKIETLVRITGASVADAIAYLEAEAGSVGSAAMSYRGDLCARVASELKASAAGVVVTYRGMAEAAEFVIWAIGTDGKMKEHAVTCGCTSAERLAKHVAGFIENHLASFAPAH